MQIADLLTPERVQILPSMSSKKKLLEHLGELLAQDLEQSPRQIYESLYQREQQGDTTLGNGVAIPHGKLHDVPGDMPLVGALLKLNEPIDFDNGDQPVDIILAMVVPESACEQSQESLQQLATQLQNPLLQQQIRSATDAATLYDLLASWSPEEYARS